MKKLKVLLLGSGAREHCIAESLIRSPQLESLTVAPGNAGTEKYNVEIKIDDHGAVVDFCRAEHIDLVVVGPEVPLVAGIADRIREAGVACFGPSQAAAQLEGSKTFTREFAARHNIPGPENKSFTDAETAVAWAEKFAKPLVVKADGLAAGKGVLIPDTRAETERAIFDLLAEKSLGEAGATVVLEERLEGEELSLFGIADGSGVRLLGSAQDHKRVGEGDTGLNTGGMGAFAPVPGMAEREEELAELFLYPAIAGMAAEGMPYVGVLYAGVMLTASGPKLIEYNCRFGDPEAQVLLPLVGSDLLELLNAAANGSLDEVKLNMVPDTTAATVVIAARGYPTSPALGVEIPEIELPADVTVSHAATERKGDRIFSTGGRVLSVTGTGENLVQALDRVYSVVDKLTGDELFARKDIGWRHTGAGAYADAGVSLAAAAEVTNRIAGVVASTQDERVIAGFGSFGGVFDLASLSDFEDPLLVSSTDTLGTKPLVTAAMDSWEAAGEDIIGHSANDVLVQGAKPLFFLDTISSASLSPQTVARLVEGMVGACKENDCILLGGETAEVPGMIVPGAVDVAGTIVGVVERTKLLPKPSIAPGHILIGMKSSGLHTNGFTLARKIVQGTDLNDPLPDGDGKSIGEALIATHRSYLRPLEKALEADLVDGLAHITGGGLIDNIPRVLPDGCGATIDVDSWEWLPIFKYLVEQGGVEQLEAHQVFNLGIGMVAIVSPEKVEHLEAAIDEPTFRIGTVVAGQGVSLQ